MKVARCLSP